MLVLSTILFIFIVFIRKPCSSITNGDVSVTEKPFMVYLVQSEYSYPEYDSWLCNGALISEHQVLTSAACLIEVTNLYVIAGYRKYVNWKELDQDECTKQRKNRVVKTCTPKEYSFSYEKLEQWMKIDVGVAVVENPYNFSDNSYRLTCSYVPKPIQIYYDEIAPLRSMTAYAWGSHYYRSSYDVLDPNTNYLREMRTVLSTKEECTKFVNNTKLKALIVEQCICTTDKSKFDVEGNFVRNWNNHVGVLTTEARNALLRQDNAETTAPTTTTEDPKYPALCQNDHGAPLVTYIGTTEVLIGLGLGSIRKKDNLCHAPSIFISMHCTGKIVYCLVEMTNTARNLCAEENQLKTSFEENTMSWEDDY